MSSTGRYHVAGAIGVVVFGWIVMSVAATHSGRTFEL
jgi:hypothetical protein